VDLVGNEGLSGTDLGLLCTLFVPILDVLGCVLLGATEIPLGFGGGAKLVVGSSYDPSTAALGGSSDLVSDESTFASDSVVGSSILPPPRFGGLSDGLAVLD